MSMPSSDPDREVPRPTPSPCVRQCTLSDDDVCMGCGRALEDITHWYAMSDEEKAACVARGRERLVQMRRPLPAYPPLPR